MSRLRAAHGQAAVELVALLPALALVAALLWQCVVAGQSVWHAAGAATRAARAAALAPADPVAAARRAAAAPLPARLRAGTRVRLAEDGVVVAVPVPAVTGRGRLATVRARARFPEQR